MLKVIEENLSLQQLPPSIYHIKNILDMGYHHTPLNHPLLAKILVLYLTMRNVQSLLAPP